jgi:sugar lactone lactonase YvrE
MTAKESTTLQILMSGIAFGESPRWHDDRLWFADWGAQQIIAVDLDGNSDVIARVDFPSFPLSLEAAGWAPADRLGARWAPAAPGARRVAGRPRRPEQPGREGSALERDRRRRPRQHLHQQHRI